MHNTQPSFMLKDGKEQDKVEKVSIKSTWSPAAGYSRQQEIEIARQAALKEHQQQLEAMKPLNVRVQELSDLVESLQLQVKELQNGTKRT